MVGGDCMARSPLNKIKGTIKKGVLSILTYAKSRKYKPLVIPRDDEQALNLLTGFEINEMADIAQSKSPYRNLVKKDLERYYKRVAAIANKHIEEGRKIGTSGEGMDYIEFSLAQSFAEKGLFPTAKKAVSLTVRQIENAILDIFTYSESDEFYPKENAEMWEEMRQRFSDKGFNVTDDVEWEKMKGFLNSDEYNYMSKLIGSDVVVDDINHMLQNGHSLDEIMKSFKNAMLTNETNYIRIMERGGISDWWKWYD